LLPVRHLQQWIEHNILLELASAPFSKEDAALVPEAGVCLDCPKRTGHNVLLFEGLTHADQCSDPKCYAAKVEAHVRQTIAAKPLLVQISTGYGVPKDGSAAVPRNKYVEIRNDKPTNQKQRDWPEYKTCKFTTEAIVTEGAEKGELRRVCANPECPVHHAKKQRPNIAADAGVKAEQEKRRREEALAQTTGLRVLGAIVEAVPVRLMKRDLLFVVERLAAMLDERRLAIVLRQHGIGKAKGPADTPTKLLVAFVRKAVESNLGRLLVEIVILHSASTVNDSGKLLKEAADFYKVDVNAITTKVKQEFAAKERTNTAKKAAPKSKAKTEKKPSAA
jgi:ParB family chromosome partitioning protein